MSTKMVSESERGELTPSLCNQYHYRELRELSVTLFRSRGGGRGIGPKRVKTAGVKREVSKGRAQSVESELTMNMSSSIVYLGS